VSWVESSAAWSSVSTGWERRDPWLSAGMRPVTERLLAELDPQPGDRVVEVGCGIGEVGRLAAERVGADGHVLFTDQSQDMVEAALRHAAGLDNVDGRAMDAQAMALDDASVDRLVSRFAYMLVPDPAKGLAEARRIMRPSGRLAFAVWTEARDNPWAQGRALVELGYMEQPEPDAPGPFRLADPDRLRSLVTEAGLAEPAVDAVDIVMRYASLEEWWEVTQDLAMSIRQALAGLSPEQRDELFARLSDPLAQYESADGVAIPGRAWVVAADCL
jgi:SAM-dependent methyltransferase